MIKVLMILSNPFTNDSRVYNEAKSLIKSGKKVTILARDKKNIHPIYDNIDGIEIVRVRNLWYMSIIPKRLFDLFFWWNLGYRRAVELFRKDDFDIIHCHDLDTLPIGIKLKKKFKKPLIYDAHEIWGYMISRGVFWWKHYVNKEKHIIKHVDRIITVNQILKEYFQKFTNTPITVVMNCKHIVDTNYEKPNNKKLTLVYLGAINKSRFILELADVAGEIRDVKCIIAGAGKKNYLIKLRSKSAKYNNVEFLGKIPMKDVIPMTKKSDVVICMTSPYDRNNSIATANKQFEAMVSGRPIICTKKTYPGVFTEKYNVGLTAEFNKKSLKKAILKLKKNPQLCEKLGKNALKQAIEKFNWKKQEEKLIKLYEGLIK